jgi:ATP-dependent DNA helicase DinG
MDDFAAHPIWDAGLGISLDNFVQVLASIREGVETVADRMEVEEETDNRSQLLLEVKGVVRRLAAVMDGLLLTLRPSATADRVRWIERTGTRPLGSLPFPVGLTTVPLDVAGALKENLFDRIETIVLTSATLATGGDFAFLKGRVGLDLVEAKLKYEEILESPFDYPGQCLLGIPTGMSHPRRDEIRHDRATVDVIADLASITDGGIFALFTSYGALRRTASALREAVGSRWPLLVQGEGQRDKLLWTFRESGSAILLGTDSFWEGVDVPGTALRGLVIAKLPFKVPTEPLTAARLDRLRENGEDGFMSYQVPQAALKLKQGFGRLIRAQTDYGVVVLLDERIVAKRYGKIMLESLPPAERAVLPWPELRERARVFFDERSGGGGIHGQ